MSAIDVNLDVSEEEATSLMYHHLVLAQSFFEASHTELQDIIDAAPKQLKDSVWFEPVLAWLEAMNKQY